MARKKIAKPEEEKSPTDERRLLFEKVQKLLARKKLPKTISVLGKRRLIDWIQESDAMSMYSDTVASPALYRAEGGIVLIRDKKELEQRGLLNTAELRPDFPHSEEVTVIRGAGVLLTAVLQDDDGRCTIFKNINLNLPY